jgi:hypothetical protein
MVPEASLNISRRQFLAAGGLTVTAACFAPSYLVAQTEGLVQGAFKEAAVAKVTVQNSAATSAFFWMVVEILPFSLALTESCWWMRRSSPRVQTSRKPSPASMRIPSNN